MMNVITIEALDSERWNQRIADIAAPMQLTTEWAAFVQAKDGVRPYFYESSDGTSACGILYLASSSRWPLSLWPTAFSDCLPVGPGDSTALPAVEQLLRERGVVEFQQNSFAFDGDAPFDLASLGFSTLERLEFGLSLQDGCESAWQRFRPTLRNDLRRFERCGVVCALRNDLDLVGVLHAIEQETAVRHQTQGKVVRPMVREVYQMLWTHLVRPGRARVYIAEQADNALAFAVIGAIGEQAYYIYGGAKPEALKLNAPKGLLWYAIQAEYERGVRHMNLGGMAASAAQPESVDHGLYKFKTAFGASETRCVSGRKTLRPVTASTLSRLRQFTARLKAG